MTYWGTSPASLPPSLSPSSRTRALLHALAELSFASYARVFLRGEMGARGRSVSQPLSHLRPGGVRGLSSASASARPRSRILAAARSHPAGVLGHARLPVPSPTRGRGTPLMSIQASQLRLSPEQAAWAAASCARAAEASVTAARRARALASACVLRRVRCSSAWSSARWTASYHTCGGPSGAVQDRRRVWLPAREARRLPVGPCCVAKEWDSV